MAVKTIRAEGASRSPTPETRHPAERRSSWTSILREMRAVLLEVDEKMLAERQRLGHDKWDEMWEGVLHMVPSASERHQSLKAELVVALRPAARRHGWKVTTDTGVFASDDDYRVPDLVVYAKEAASQRGVEGAPELVIEVRSPHDETYEKVPWYQARGAKAVLVIDRDTLALQLVRAAWGCRAGC